ncbi:MAG: hypothetical protein K1X75_06925 [Leptospirales bacterium]|nr:hypothetical protein [Leptospirales bacterium]
MEFLDLLRDVAPEGLDVYSGRLQNLADGFHIEVELDGLKDPRGAVSLQDCERYSHRLIERVDLELSMDSRWRSALPPGLSTENYSVEVSSAGAERELRLPQELDRFRATPLFIRFQAEGTTHDAIVHYLGRGQVEGQERLLFERFEPRSRRARRQKGRGTRRATVKELTLEPAQLSYARLYLDF